VQFPGDESFFDEIERRYELGGDDKMILAAARQAFRRWAEITAIIDAEGVLVRGRYEEVPRAHPLLGAERAARNAVAELLVKLKLPPPEVEVA
jgi:hypothetical protein